MKAFSLLALGTACSISLYMGAAIQPAAAVSEVEPNDPFANRQFLPSNTDTIDGSISSGDVDFFTFSGLNPGNLFVAEITFGTFYPVLGWLDDSGNLLDVVNDDAEGIQSILAGRVPASGKLNLGVAGEPDPGYDFNFPLGGEHSESGSYTLSLKTSPVFSYTADEVPFIFEDISETGTRVLEGDDDTPTSADLGFTFNFFGTDYNNVFWSPNGLMTFGGGSSYFYNADLTERSPDVYFPILPTIAVLWDDWQFFSPGTDASYYQTLGTPGNQRFITQWNFAKAPQLDSPSAVTFQAVLFEGSNDILFSYLDVDSEDTNGFGHAFGKSATVGIRDIDSQLSGESVQWSFNSPVIRNRQSIRFSPDSPETIPEPTSVLGVLAFGAFGTGSLLKRKQKQH